MDLFKTNYILNKYNLFWQYPVITEEEFYHQNKENSCFIGLPWATMIDKKYKLEFIYRSIKPFVKSKNNFTCCQHIFFKRFIDLWKSLEITKVYCVHKVKGEDIINGVEILPCPLYAVNIEDKKRNSKFIDVNYLNKERNLLYSFIGSYSPSYISDIRKRIYDVKHPKNCLVENTNIWHFRSIVYSEKQNKKKN